jgi:hypothetical protein
LSGNFWMSGFSEPMPVRPVNFIVMESRRLLPPWMMICVFCTLAGCTCDPNRGDAQRVHLEVPVDMDVGLPSVTDPGRIVDSGIRGRIANGAVTLHGGYDIVYGNPTAANALLTGSDWQGTLATEQFSQAASVVLPAGLAPLQIDWNAHQIRSLNSSGILTGSDRQVTARWAPGPLRFEVSPQGFANGVQTCLFSASLHGPVLPMMGDAALNFSQRRCSRMIDGRLEQSDLRSGSAEWHYGRASSTFSFTRYLPRLPEAGDASHGGSEFGARQTLTLQDWALSGQVMLQSVAGDDAQSALNWASRARISRKFWGAPVSASWQRSNPELWSLSSDAVASEQAALMLGLTPQLRRWLDPAIDADLSWQWLHPYDPQAGVDQRVMMNFSYGLP